MSEFKLNELIKQAEDLRRKAERQMFNGKKDEAAAILSEAQAAFSAAKTAEPDNPQVKGMEAKLNKLQKDLERRMGKPMGSEPPKAAPAAPPKPTAPRSATPTAPAAQTGTAKPTAKADLPYHARQPLQKAQNQLRSMESNFKSLEQADMDMAKSLLSRIESNITQGKQMLESAAAEAAKAGVNEHPDLEALTAAFADAEKRLENAGTKNAEQAAQAAAASEIVDADCNALKDEAQRLMETFNKCGLITYNDLPPLEEQIQLIESFEQNELNGLKERLQAFENKYGSTRDEIDKNAGEAGYTGYDRPGYGWSSLTEGIARVAETRKQMAENIIDRVEDRLAHLNHLHDFSHCENHDSIREWFKMAERYSHDHPKVEQTRQTIESRLKEDLDAFYARVDARTWPGNSTGDTAEAALKYFKESSDWAHHSQPRHPLGVSIHGDWSVQERDLLQQPVMYGIPAFVAVQLDHEREEKLVRVFDVTMRTAQGAGIKPEPPFFSITVGNSFYIRPDKIT